MDLYSLSDSLEEIRIDEFGLNQILINLILQIFLKNDITDPNDIINSIAQYLNIENNLPLINLIASKLNIILVNQNWCWID